MTSALLMRPIIGESECGMGTLPRKWHFLKGKKPVSHLQWIPAPLTPLKLAPQRPQKWCNSREGQATSRTLNTSLPIIITL